MAGLHLVKLKSTRTVRIARYQQTLYCSRRLRDIEQMLRERRLHIQADAIAEAAEALAQIATDLGKGIA